MWIYVMSAALAASIGLNILLIVLRDRSEAEHEEDELRREVAEADTRLQRYPKAAEHPQSNAAPSLRSPAQ